MSPDPGYSYDVDGLSGGLDNIDTILLRMHQLRHLKWSFVIYRTPYDDDDAWGQFVQILKDKAYEELGTYGRIWFKDSFELTVIEDKEKLEGASKDTIRLLFHEWVSEAVRSGDGQGPDAKVGDDAFFYPFTPRYDYCVYVDQECLSSTVKKLNPYIVILKRDWALPQTQSFEREEDEFDSEEDDPLDDGYPPVEGCKLQDVGWMKIPPISLVSVYKDLHNNGWYNIYARPPQIMSW